MIRSSPRKPDPELQAQHRTMETPFPALGVSGGGGRLAGAGRGDSHWRKLA